MSKRLNIIIIFLFSLAPLLWFRGGLMIAGGDAPIFLDPVNFFMSSVRYPIVDITGAYPFNVSLIFPFLLFYYVVKAVGLSLLTAEKALFVLYYIAAGLSMHYMMSVVVKGDSRASNAARLIASLFYMMNYFTVLMTPMLSQYIVYVLLPLIVGLYIRGIQPGENLFKRCFLFATALSFLATGFTNPPFLLMVVFILVLYTVFDLVVINGFSNFSRVISFAALSAALYLLFNFWLLSVWGAYLTSQGGAPQALMPGYWNPGSTLDRTIAMQGSWAWNDRYFPGLYSFYEKTYFKIFVYAFPAAVFAVLFFRIKNLKVYFFLFLALMGIFLAKGRWGLLGGVYAYMFDHYGVFRLLREPYTKFTAFSVLGYSVLLGVFVSKITGYLALKARKLEWGRVKVKAALCGVNTFAVCMIAFNSWPVFTGDLIFDRRWEIPSFRVKVPDYWEKAAGWFNQQEGDFRILELPENKWASVWLDWENGFAAGGNPCTFLFNKQTLHSPELNITSREIFPLLRDGLTPKVYKLLQMFGVKYILQRNDYLWKTLNTDPPARVKKMLAGRENISLRESFGKLDIYEVIVPSSRFTMSEDITGVFGGPAALGPMVPAFDMERTALYFFNQFGAGQDREWLGKISRLVIYNSSFEDLAKRFVDDAYKLNPAGNLNWTQNDPSKGWAAVSDLNKDPLTEEERRLLNGNYLSGGSAVFTASTNPMAMRFHAGRGGKYKIFARAALLPDSVAVALSVDGAQVAELGLKETGRNRLRWFEAGDVDLKEGAHEISIRSAGGRALIDDILIIPGQTLKDTENWLRKIVYERKIQMDYLTPRGSGASVISAGQLPDIKYNMFGASRYRIEVPRLSKPAYLIFKEAFDGNWGLFELKNGADGYPLKKFDLLSAFRGRAGLRNTGGHLLLNGYANGFLIEAGPRRTFVLENRLQRVFEFGVLLSLTSFIICSIIFLFVKCRDQELNELKIQPY